MIQLGNYNTLRIKRRTEHGLYLNGGEREGNILLPQKYVTPSMRPGQELEVFIYLDQEERPVATTEHPYARVGEFACLEVAWVNKYGAFLKWGLEKDLFCPFREQKARMELGRYYMVYVCLDEDSYRLMATANVEKHLSSVNDDKPETPFAHGDEVDILVWQKTDLGHKVIVNNRYYGQVYSNQVFQQLTMGMSLKAYVDHVRQDGKIDLTLQPTGHRHTLDFAETLLRYLYEHDGYCALGDKSPAEDIYSLFQVSKKVYKRAVGDLYKRHLISFAEEGGVVLSEE